MKLIHGDCLDVMREMPDASLEALITDPPYSSGTRREAAKSLRGPMLRGDRRWITSDNLTTVGLEWFLRSIAVESKRIVVPGGHLLCFIDWRMSPTVRGAIESADWRVLGCVVWNKMHFGMGPYFRNQHEFILHFANGGTPTVFRHDIGNVISARPIRGGAHPTEKPVDLMRALVTTVTPERGTVLDCFMGSGSTGVACVHTDRDFIGIEHDRGYFEIAEKRIRAAENATPLFA